MRSVKFYFYSCLFFLCSTVKAGSPEPALKRNTPTVTSPFLFTAGYRMPLNKARIINSGHGLYLEGGINIGKLFSEKLIVGVYGGWGWRDVLWATSFNPAFAADYKASSNNQDRNISSLDSSVISASADLFTSRSGRSPLNIPGCETKTFNNYSMYYGIMIKLPYSYIPALKLYTGTTRAYYIGDNIVSKGDYNMFQLRRSMYGLEAVLLNACIKNPGRCLASFSAYCEVYNFSRSTLYFSNGITNTSIPLQRFASPAFIRKYNNEAALGFRLSVSIL